MLSLLRANFDSDIHVGPRKIFWLSHVARQVVGVAILNKTYNRGYSPLSVTEKKFGHLLLTTNFDLDIHAAHATNSNLFMNCPLSNKL